MRLVGGTTPNKGRVEVYRYGYWGSICRDGWNLPDASVVCRMLGYSGAWSATCCSEYQGGTGPVWLSGLNCNGREESLSECSHGGWGVTNCDHTKDAEIICHSPPTDKPLPHYSKETTISPSSSYVVSSSSVASTTPAGKFTQRR